MLNQFSRTELMFGPEAMDRLAKCHVAVFGIGGVGGHTAEALVRSGIGALDLIDDDRVCLTNLNRQIFATLETVGQYKVDAAEARLKSINPELRLKTHRAFYLPDNAGDFDLAGYDYIVDAVDTMAAKLALAENAQAAGTPIISAMGTGNKLDPTAFEIADIYETSICPLARIMRRECRKRGIRHLKCVYSKEVPRKPRTDTDAILEEPPSGSSRRQIPASNAFVPAVAGMIIAGEVLRELADIH